MVSGKVEWGIQFQGTFARNWMPLPKVDLIGLPNQTYKVHAFYSECRYTIRKQARQPLVNDL